jgi:hypothetical protein
MDGGTAKPDADMLDATACEAGPYVNGQQTCALCANEWFCSSGEIVSQCPPNIAVFAPCTGGAQCFACGSGGMGHWWNCAEPKNVWSDLATPVACSQ